METTESYYEKDGVESDYDNESATSDINKESIGSNCEYDYDPKMWKNKTVHEDDHDIALILSIFRAEGINKPNSTNPHTTDGIYKVEFWVEIGTLHKTAEVCGSPNPEWNRAFHILLENPTECRFLNVEVIRTCSNIDPGTSAGEVLAGRAQVPLPGVSTKIEGSFELVKAEGPGCKAEGHIILAMELIKLRKM